MNRGHAGFYQKAEYSRLKLTHQQRLEHVRAWSGVKGAIVAVSSAQYLLSPRRSVGTNSSSSSSSWLGP